MQFEAGYRKYLSLIRQNQSGVKIVCITLLYTRKTENARTHFTPQDFRNAVARVVKEYQKTDKNLALADVDKITSVNNLQSGENTDPVHLSVKDAEDLANALYAEITKLH